MEQDYFFDAFNSAMKYEVGAFWDPYDEDVITGKMQTREQRRKVGYVNIPSDRGGETKYGIAQKANPDIDVRNLTLDQAADVYFTDYWLRGCCDQLVFPVCIMHFDGCVNHGIGRANKFLQRAVGVQDDGVIGPQTIDAVNSMTPAEVIDSISDQRTAFYNRIVDRDPSQRIFLNGWMRRISEVTAETLALT